MAAALAATVFVSLVTLVLGSVQLVRGGTEVLIAAGVVSLVICVAVGVVGLALEHAAQRRQYDLQDRLADLNQRLGESAALLRRIREQTMLSDSAKAILYRKDERTLIQNAIDEETTRENWYEALVLVEEMMQRFGATAELAQMKANVESARLASAERDLDAQIESLEQLLDSGAWEEATREAERISHAFPDSPRARQLIRRVDEARREHKQGLLDAFHEAADRGDHDRAMHLLHQLDQHLTEAEAAPLAETARSVIANYRELQGERFRDAVRRHDWRAAVELGEHIVEQFPNAKMAQEVRDMMEGLRARAAGETNRPMPMQGDADRREGKA
jgi:hypothetical protein